MGSTLRAWSSIAILACAGCGAKTGLALAPPDASRPGPRIDATVPRDARIPASDAGMRDAICALAAPNASVSGTTPLGPIDARFAWASEIEACSSLLFVGEEPGLDPRTMRPPEPMLVLVRRGGTDVSVTVRAGGEEREVLGRLEVHEHVPPNDDPRARGGDFCVCTPIPGDPDPPCAAGAPYGHVTADLVVVAPGWSLEGSLRAPQCHALHAICF